MYFADARELVEDLLLFCLQLLGVGEILPFATAADAEMSAARLDAKWTFLYETMYPCLAERMFLACNLKVNDIARHCPRNEHDQVVDASESLALSRYIGDGNISKYR